MPPLPILGGKEFVRIFGLFGWQVARQSGSHIILINAESTATLSVPDHNEVAKGTLRSLMRASGLTVTEFIEKR
jgi:predicted RNA binding protein YcfA (HicA-like mRNA interferase family)